MNYASRLQPAGWSQPIATIGAPSDRVAPRAMDPKLVEQDRLASLVAAMAQGEEAALGDLYDLTIGRVHGFALRIVADRTVAEEIASDVFLQAWRDARRYEQGRSRVITWLLMMCRSRALDRLRAHDDHEVLHANPESLVGEREAPEVSPQDLLEAVERSHALHEALRGLTAVQRQLLSLAFFRGLSHQEIAEHTNLPLGTVKSHIRRALESMREHLGLEQP